MAFCQMELNYIMQMASILEGGGKTPAVHPQQLAEMGFKLVAYPLSLLSVSVRAQQAALQQLKQVCCCSESCALQGPACDLCSFQQDWPGVAQLAAKQ